MKRWREWGDREEEVERRRLRNGGREAEVGMRRRS